jgi:protein ImuA
MTRPAPHHPMEAKQDRAALLATLLATLGGVLAREAAPAPAGVVPLAPGIDAALPGGGLARSAIHEILVAETASSTAFCGYILGRASGTVAWILPDPPEDLPWPPGLATLGLPPGSLLLLTAKGNDALWAAEQALRCPALSAVAAVLPGLGLAAARRLQLAAEAGGTLGLLLRPGGDRPGPTASRTRWHVAPLAGAGGAPHRLGAPRWRLCLLLARGAKPGSWDVTFDHDHKTLIVNEGTSGLAHG